jgi:hypothetical protein
MNNKQPTTCFLCSIEQKICVALLDFTLSHFIIEAFFAHLLVLWVFSAAESALL